MARRKRKNPGGGMDIALIAGAAGLAYYFLFYNKLPAGVPSTGNANGYYPKGGGTLAAPLAGDEWLNIPGTPPPTSLTLSNIVAYYNGTAWVPYVPTTTAAPVT